VLSDALKGLPIGGVPRIEMVLENKTEGCDASRLIARVGGLKWASLPAQNVGSRRMDLAMDDDIVRLWCHWHGTSRWLPSAVLKRDLHDHANDHAEELSSRLDRQLFTIAQAVRRWKVRPEEN